MICPDNILARFLLDSVGLYWDNVMQKKMETTIVDYIGTVIGRYISILD